MSLVFVIFIHENLPYSQRIINANLNGNIQFHDICIKEHKIDILRFLTCKVLCFVLVRLESLTLHQNIFGIHEMSQATLTYTLLYVPTLVTIDQHWSSSEKIYGLICPKLLWSWKLPHVFTAADRIHRKFIAIQLKPDCINNVSDYHRLSTIRCQADICYISPA